MFFWFVLDSNCLQRLSVEYTTSSVQIVTYDATIQEHFLKWFSEFTRLHGFIKYAYQNKKYGSITIHVYKHVVINDSEVRVHYGL